MLALFKRKKAGYIAKVLPDDLEVFVKPGETLLYSALSQGIRWPHKCKVGSCGKCKYQLIKGEINPQLDFSYVLEPEDVENGYGLACQSILKTDVEVNVNTINSQERTCTALKQ